MFDDRGLALRGLLVRHLVMPGELAGTREAMRFLAREVSTDTYFNVMDQYRPEAQVLAKPEQYAEINRRVSSMEVRRAVQTAREEGSTGSTNVGARRRCCSEERGSSAGSQLSRKSSPKSRRPAVALRNPRTARMRIVAMTR